MSESIRLAVLGGDERQSFMSRELARRGYTVSVWGLEKAPSLHPLSALEDWREAVKDASAVVLPLPVTEDGVRIRSPLHDGPSLRWQTLLESVSPDVKLLAGKASEGILRLAGERGICVADYLLNEGLQLKNAMVTAEGAISLAMTRLPVTVDGCQTAIIGYGRIGKFLAERLIALGASVTVYARREDALTEARLHHCCGRLLWSQEQDKHPLSQELSHYRVIFNTVPHRLLESDVLCHIPKNCLLMDLASLPGGIDFKAAEELGLEALWATALPGKYAPESAGQILGEAVDEILRGSLSGGMQNQYGKDE